MEENKNAPVKFGPIQVFNVTPMWAKWIFRVPFVLITIAIFIINGDPSIQADFKVILNNYFTGASMGLYLISKMFGVDVKKDIEQ